MINIRPLLNGDIPRLASIRPTYQTSTVLALKKTGSDLSIQWQLYERILDHPFDKGALYDFGESAQLEISNRLQREEDSYQRIAEENDTLIGLLDMEYQVWNNTVFLWNLMIDLSYRQQGLGRRLWLQGLNYARRIEARAVMIETQNTNIPACRFYLSMGCQLMGFNESLYTSDALEKDTTEFALFWTYFLTNR